MLPDLPSTPNSQDYPEDEDAKWEREAWARAKAAQESSSLPSPLSRRGADAVWSRDEQALRSALAEGWELPTFRHARASAGTSGHDLGMVFGVVSAGWLAGWRLLRERWPELAANEQMLLTALAAVKPAILEDIMDHVVVSSSRESRQRNRPKTLKRMEAVPGLVLEASPPEHAEQSLALVHRLFSPLCREVGAPPSQEEVVACARILMAHGERCDIPYPGNFDDGDMSLAGHTLWTIAIRERKWGIARDLAPRSNEEMLAHPRYQEALDEWFDCALLGGRVLSYRLPPSQEALDSLVEILPALVMGWLECSDRLLRPEGWPLLLAMPSQGRILVWEHLLEMGEMNGLNWIAMSARECQDLAAEVLRKMHGDIDDKSRLLQAWNRPEPVPTPSALWKQQTGHPFEWPSA